MSVGQIHSNAAGDSSTLTDFVAMQSLKGNLAKSWALANYNVIHNCKWFKEEDVCQLWDIESQDSLFLQDRNNRQNGVSMSNHLMKWLVKSLIPPTNDKNFLAEIKYHY